MIHVNFMKGVHQSLGKLLPLFVIFVSQNFFFVLFCLLIFKRLNDSHSYMHHFRVVLSYEWQLDFIHDSLFQNRIIICATTLAHMTQSTGNLKQRKRKIEKFLNCVIVTNTDKNEQTHIFPNSMSNCRRYRCRRLFLGLEA